MEALMISGGLPRNYYYEKMHGKTNTANHPIQLWVVFTWHKTLMTFLNGQIPLKTHQSGHAMGSNDGLQIEFFHSTFSNHLGGFS